MGFKCGAPAGDDDATNTAAEEEEPAGTHNPFAGSTYTPAPSPNAAGMGIAGVRRRGEVGRGERGWEWGVWGVGWGIMCGVVAFVL